MKANQKTVSDLADHADALSGVEAPPAPKAKVAPVAAAPKVSKNIPPNRVRLAGYLHNIWDITAPRDIVVADILNTDYWKHVAAQFRPYDQLNVLAEDGAWYARLLVVSCDILWAKVYKLEYHDLTAASADRPLTQEEEYEVSWTAFAKFAISKKANPGLPPLKDGFQTKLEAYQWLDGHLKTLNG